MLGSYEMLRRFSAIFLTLSLTVSVFAQSDEAALRSAVAKYFDAYTKKDVEAFAALWSDQSSGRVTRREVMQRQVLNEDFTFSEPAISRFKVEGDFASLRVSTRRIAVAKNTDVRRMTDVRVEMSFVRENGQWKLWGEASPVGALLLALTDAKTDEQRRTLLDQEAELLTRELLFQLSGESDRAYVQGNHTRALSLLQSVVLVAERINDRNEVANAWHNIGIIHFVKLRYAESLEAYRKSLAIEEEVGRKPETARALNSIALVHLAQSRFTEALDHFQRVLALYESLNRNADVAQTYENIGNVYYEQGEYARAVEFYQECVKRYDTANAKSSAAYRVLKIARVEYEQGRDAVAVEFYQQAVARLTALGDRRSLGYGLHNIANIYYEQGDYNQALGFYQRSLQAEREAGTREGEAGALQGIGLIHSLNGNHALALDAHQKNLAVAQALNSKQAIAAAWQKVGGSCFSLGKLDDALAAYQQSLSVREPLGDLQETAQALLDVGVTLAAKQDFAAAMEYYKRSRELYEQAKNLAGVAAVLLNVSMAHYVQTDYAKTLEVAGQAAMVAKQSNEPDLFWQARYRIGKAHYRLNDLAAARQALTEAITTIETIRPQLGRAQQPRFFESRIAPYLAMADVAISEGQGNEAFHFAERAKFRVLTGLLQNARTQIVKTMTVREQERERQLLGEITLFNSQFYREQERDKPNQARIAELKTRLQKAQSDYASFRTRLYALHPQLKVLRGELKPVTVEQAAVSLPDTKTALLEFVETEEHVYLFVFARRSPKAARAKTLSPTIPVALNIFVLETNRADLFARVSKFNQAIANRDSINAQARELYDLLLKEAQPALEGKTQLLIVPDVVSWSLPFQALRTSAERFLIEDFAIAYTPSLTILSTINSARPTSPNVVKPGAAATPVLLAVGNPALSQNATERIKAALQSQQLDGWPETEREAVELAKLYGTQQSLLLTGADASEDRINAEIGKHRFVYLAARGINHEASPLFSALIFAPNNNGKEDGFLELRDVLRLEMNAELVVTSASEWTAPNTVINRTMTAWTWAWHVAGSQTTLASNWRVESASTVELMLELHRQLKDTQTKPSKAFAWRAAVQKLLVSEPYRHPYFWAGFVMLGRV